MTVATTTISCPSRISPLLCILAQEYERLQRREEELSEEVASLRQPCECNPSRSPLKEAWPLKVMHTIMQASLPADKLELESTPHIVEQRALSKPQLGIVDIGDCAHAAFAGLEVGDSAHGAGLNVGRDGAATQQQSALMPTETVKRPCEPGADVGNSGNGFGNGATAAANDNDFEVSCGMSPYRMPSGRSRQSKAGSMISGRTSTSTDSDEDNVCTHTESLRVERDSCVEDAEEPEDDFMSLWNTWKSPPSRAFFDVSSLDSGEGLAEQFHKMRASGVHGTELRSDNCMQPLVLRPEDMRILFWHLLSFACITYDAIFLPMQAFPLPGTEIRNKLDLVTGAFWFLDMILSFFVGYWREHFLEMRPWPVAKAYITTWFGLDLVIVSLDFILLFTTSGGAFFRIFRSFKALRVLRMARVFRLLRLAKVVAQINSMTDFILSESLITVFKVTKMVLAVLALSHFIACAWFTLGSLEEDYGERTWVSKVAEASGRDETWLSYYLTAMHWSLTQFTPGSMEVVPVNEMERSFTIVVILLALIIFSSILSTITAAMTHLRIMKTEQYQVQYQIRAYFKQNMISLGLSSSIHKYLRTMKKQAKKRIQEDDVGAFKQIPESLRSRLRIEVRVPTIMHHPFFQVLIVVPDVNRRICNEAMLETHLAMQEELFMPSAPAKHMYFVRNGFLHYECPTLKDGYTQDLLGGETVAEMTLWVNWVHQGQLLSVVSCELFALNAAEFRNIIKNTGLHRQCCEYAHLFAKALSKLRMQNGGTVPDTWSDRTVIMEIVRNAFFPHRACCPLAVPASRVAVNSTSLAQFLKGSSSKSKGLETT